MIFWNFKKATKRVLISNIKFLVQKFVARQNVKLIATPDRQN